MKRRHKLFTALGVSVLIHALFFVFSTKITIEAVKERDTPRKKQYFKIKKLHTSVEQKTVVKVDQVDFSKRLKFQSPNPPQNAKSVFSEAASIKKNNVLEKKEEKFDKPIESSAAQYKTKEDDQAKDFKLFKKDVVVSSADKLIELAKLSQENVFARPDEIIEEDESLKEFSDKMPGFTPKWNPTIKDFPKENDKKVIKRDYQPAISKKENYSSLKEFLVSEVLTYQDPETKEKFFQINMKVGKDSEELATLSKEIIFLIDCSKSTTTERLQQFKEGLEYSLRHLNEGDTFNVLAFKKFIIEYKPIPVAPTEENIKKAVEFVDELTLGTRTDAFNALYSSISKEATKLPSYIIFLSDGHPTQGITDPQKIIYEISDVNNGQRSIFAFSGGLNVNRYLLDFITYRNRGWSEYSYRTHLIGEAMTGMYEKIRDPILVNMRYHVNGLAEEEMFPKLLPDFFRNVEFSLFGKFDEEDKFVMQVLGNVHEKPTELVIEASLNQAAQGDESIAKNWAYNKVYDLIGQLNRANKDKQVIEQIEQLAQKYKIEVPYLDEIKRSGQ